MTFGRCCSPENGLRGKLLFFVIVFYDIDLMFLFSAIYYTLTGKGERIDIGWYETGFEIHFFTIKLIV